ncbi:hypothetical protein VTI74DRAFT_2034 [Chaetomium olivicolor]
MVWDYYLHNREATSILAAIKHLFSLLDTQFQIRPRALETDNEFARVTAIQDFCSGKGTKIEPSAPDTPAQNGGAERSGGVIKEKARAMRIGANLPAQLWPETTRAAVYLNNRSPKLIYDWRSPYERFHAMLAQEDTSKPRSKQPCQSHLKVYGCKAFAMTRAALKGQEKTKRLAPRAWVGYLVGYSSTNIYRIWNPVTNQVVATRDVVFNEKQVFPGNLEAIKTELAEVDLEELKGWLNAKDQADDSINQVQVDEDEEPVATANSAHEDEGVLEVDEEEEHIEDTIVVKGDDSGTFPEFYPTPPPSPPGDLLAAAFAGIYTSRPPQPQRRRPRIEPMHAAFHAGTLASIVETDGKPTTRASAARARRKPQKWRSGNQSITAELLDHLRKQPGGLATLHESQLPPPPRWHPDLYKHPLGKLFLQAEEDHLQSHHEMGSWTETPRRQGSARNKQILGCMWVYTYKFNTRGYLAKCKARLVVRGDQQIRSHAEENYSATLAVRSLRTTLALAARFDLELIQFDAVNAFVNAKIDDEVYMEMPGGYRKPGRVLKLQKALYGLRQSPLLWQKELQATLVSLGFKPVPHEPCMMMKDQCIVFYYVDDIVIAYRRQKQAAVDKLITGLQSKYRLTGGNELRWFLGIEVHRDRRKRLIWLAQTSYIEKITKLTRSEAQPRTPMATVEQLPFDGIASHSSTTLYQRKVGSALYAAVTTRPDIAFAVSRLARFNQNPGPEHHEAIDRVLRYLYTTRFLALQLGGGDDLRVASDASFADNSIDRKSSQGYAITLFGGLIAWRASKQDTVTTSTTEAELLALAQAAKEGLFAQRLLTEMDVQLDDSLITIECDNTQTIRLVNAEVATLQTKLRHVDIHNHWLRQEAARGRINVEYVPSKQMVADGLTKPLTADNHHKFIAMLNLVPIQSLIMARAKASESIAASIADGPARATFPIR